MSRITNYSEALVISEGRRPLIVENAVGIPVLYDVPGNEPNVQLLFAKSMKMRIDTNANNIGSLASVPDQYI